MEELKNEQIPAAAETAAEQAPVQAAAKKPGVQDVNGDGKVDFKDYVATAAKAAEDVYHSAAETIKEKAPEYAQKAKDAADDVKDAIVGAAAVVKEKAPEYAQKAKDAIVNTFDPKAPAAEAKPAAAPEAPKTEDTVTRI